jgi:hypothetical protein
MSWIVFGEDKGRIVLVSKGDVDFNLPNGSYITIEEGKTKFILRVENSAQNFAYSPSPMIADMDLSPLIQDQKCQNVIYATPILEYPERTEGMSFIRPQTLARLSNQDEINLVFNSKEGIGVFPATVFARSCRHIHDEKGNYVKIRIPDDVFFHQMIITGRTGSGKTVAMKYMAQYFVENFQERGGAVLAINVKEEDLLTMDKPSRSKDGETIKEWSCLKNEPRGVETFQIYYPGNQINNYSKAVDVDRCSPITLKARNIDPETLTGLIQNISEIGADQLPGIFRYWQRKVMKKNDTLGEFVKYFGDPNKERIFDIMNVRGDIFPEIQMHYGTWNNVNNALTYATEYFDVERAAELTASDILQRGKMSVIDLTAKHGIGFGAVLLRDLLEKIYQESSGKDEDERIPVLIIIDEVHSFYGNSRSVEALEILDAICRKGRSLKIGVIFASQNPGDMPPGINTVVNSKIYFKSDMKNINSLGINTSGFDAEALRPGYGVARIHNMSQLRFIKFPLSLAGVNNERKKN